ncbi:MAG: cytochrome c peroxidase [Myxococcota bacterium]
MSVRAKVLAAAVLAGCGSDPAPSTDDAGSSSAGTTDASDGPSASTSTTSVTDSSSSSSSGADDESTTADNPTLDEILQALLDRQDPPVVPLVAPEPAEPALVALGEALFFDPILSGNQDIACATCHHPDYGLSDGLSLTLGTGATGVGPARAEGPHPPFVPRHSMSLFNIGHEEFTHLFWDSRVETGPGGMLATPAGPQLLAELAGPLAAQAMFPVLDRREMRGQPGDMTLGDEPNELAALPDDDPQAIWAALMARLGAIPAYDPLFAAAFPSRTFAELTFADAANAIAAYESTAFSFPSAPWDDYLGGELTAITDAAKLGAILFYGSAGCANCHAGPLLTDHELHSTGVPQLGPGTASAAPFDYGREHVTGDPGDRFQFRTPPLRNVEVSAPYMHDGAHLDFEDLLRHYGDVTNGIADYDPSDLLPELIPTVQQGAAHIDEMNATLSDELVLEAQLAGLSNIREFLLTLTDPAVFDLPQLRPRSVPSGLDVP